ncbi:MAG: radical SAM protein [Patescibacteria group bacterium]|nr:radical SAM protein [Patescibacteria group bacterium]
MALEYVFQWHLTAQCDQRCKHCYVYDKKTYQKELRNQLSTQECFKVIRKITAFRKKLEKHLNQPIIISINFTGGDPLLRPDFFDILNYARPRVAIMRILGNSYHVDKKTAQKLFQSGIKVYQVSLDGLEKTHDFLRKKGSFKDAFRALKIIRRAGIRDTVMMTISPFNSKELLPLVDLLAQEQVSNFSFARIVNFGNAKKITSRFTPLEYRQLLLNYFWRRLKFRRENKKTQLHLKDHLFKLLFYELKIKQPYFNPGIISGCEAVRKILSILSDGTIYACRRFAYNLGNVLEDDLFQVYQSKKAQHYLDFDNFVKCRSCPLKNICRGCPAVSWGEKNSAFAPDPQCWRKT